MAVKTSPSPEAIVSYAILILSTKRYNYKPILRRKSPTTILNTDNQNINPIISLRISNLKKGCPPKVKRFTITIKRRVKSLTKHVNQIFKLSEIERTEKPRNEGITIIIDTGLGINATQDLLETASNYIDYCKMGWATWLILPKNLIKKKLKLYHDHNIQTLSGGSALEAAILTGKLEEFLETLKTVGFTAIEISTGIINISHQEKSKLIKNVKKMGFLTIITEVGRKSKEEDARLEIADRIQQIKSDLNSGADYVTIEARESGIGIGPYDEEGKVKEPFVEKIANQIIAKKTIWEAPLKPQQVWLITRFGPNTNLGNIKPTEVVPLETLRLGLRGDTMIKFLAKKQLENASKTRKRTRAKTKP